MSASAHAPTTIFGGCRFVAAAKNYFSLILFRIFILRFSILLRQRDSTIIFSRVVVFLFVVGGSERLATPGDKIEKV